MAFELAKQGHQVKLFCVLGKREETEAFFAGVKNIEIIDYGPTRFLKENSSGLIQRGLVSMAVSKLFRRSLTMPHLELTRLVWKRRKDILDSQAVISIGMPFQIHWGMGLLKIFTGKAKDIPWVADCGDPFIGNSHASGNPFPYLKRISNRMLNKANAISVPVESQKLVYPVSMRDKIHIIPQGFVIDINLPEYKVNEVPTFIYAGTFYEGLRDPRLLLNHLTKLSEPFVFHVYTRAVEFVRPFKEELGEKLVVHDYLPREELLKKLATADFLVDFQNNSESQVPSKLIDYGISKRPIMSIPFGELPEDKVSAFMKGNYQGLDLKIDVESHDIRTIARRFVDLLK
ncbi:MAG: hypothetical protein HWD92_08305 [Flavobacteriia bacterium]|nr:hypothetical protein [Flavobacteriia bacterium]